MERLNELEEKISKMNEKISKHSEALRILEHDIYGNGKEGLIKKIDEVLNLIQRAKGIMWLILAIGILEAIGYFLKFIK